MLARLLRDGIAATFQADVPAAVACLDDDFEACIAHLKIALRPLGGIRRWWICPLSGWRVAKLHLPAGATVFCG